MLKCFQNEIVFFEQFNTDFEYYAAQNIQNKAPWFTLKF